ncbi:hypothetical protein SEUCBS139899_008249 [Sporothrix eucalyptigena]
MATKEIKIFTPIGQLGQGFSEAIFWETLKGGVDAIICDGGSTDSGPGRLATGTPNVSWNRLKRDLEMFAKAAHLYRVPTLIGSMGGDGENAHVDKAAEIIAAAVERNKYRSLKILKIYSEIPKDVVRENLSAGRISPCGPAVPALTEADIDQSTRIVAQMGYEPYLKAMQEQPDFDIVVGGRAYDPAPYAAFCLFKGLKNLGTAYAMGKIMECGAQCAKPKSREALAVVREDSFDMIPLDPGSVCTTVSVASHFLYEKTRPDILVGPGGALHLDRTVYEQLDARSVRVSNAVFVPEAKSQYTVKLEGARVSGYQTIVLGALRDPICIAQLDAWIAFLLGLVEERNAEDFGYAYDLKIHRYGVNGVMGALEPDATLPKEVFIAGQVRAATQAIADQVAGMVKFGFTHAPYPGQLATAGNFAWPFTPCEIAMGHLSEFCIYHIMHGVDPVALFGYKILEAPGSNTYVEEESATALAAKKMNGKANGKLRKMTSNRKYWLTPEPEAGTCYLADVASVLRSKNAGPYELTFDVMFPTRDVYERVKHTGLLTTETICRLYSIEEKDVVASLYFDQALAYKATIVRPSVSGGFAETDTHGSQQHVPLMYLKLPFARE